MQEKTSKLFFCIHRDYLLQSDDSRHLRCIVVGSWHHLLVAYPPLSSFSAIFNIIIRPEAFGKEGINFNPLVREDCQARKLNKEDAMDRCKWRKMIKEAR